MFDCVVGFRCCSAFCGCCFAGVVYVGYFARLIWLALVCDCVSVMLLLAFLFGCCSCGLFVCVVEICLLVIVLLICWLVDWWLCYCVY